MNGLSFTDPWAGIQRSSFSSDSYALMTGFNQEGWPKKHAPIEHLRWSLAATQGAFHHWHIDSDGYGTFVKVITGSKWWIVARPKDGLDVDIFNTTSIWLDKEFDLDKTGEKLFDVEAILLQPGSELWVHFSDFFSLSVNARSRCQQYHAAQYTSCCLHTRTCCLPRRAFLRNFRRFKTRFRDWYTVLCANRSSPIPLTQNQDTS